jgi:hypothetical protein
MNILLVILFIGLFLCAVMFGASRSPKAKGIVDPPGTRRLALYIVLIIAAIVIVGIVKSNAG